MRRVTAAPMHVLTATGIEVRYGDRIVLRGCDLSVEEGARVGLVGPNGSGKTTLLRVIAGTEDPTHGDVHIVGRSRLLSQEPHLPGTTVGDALDDAVSWHTSRLAAYEQALADGHLDEAARIQALLDRDGWEQSHQVDAIASRLGCAPRDAHLANLSGGERRRVALARALLEAPDVLLLDEPTNHLDAETVQWLEGFLSGYRGTIVLVTHDRYLLEAVASEIVEVEDGLLVRYPESSYTDYLIAREERRAQLEKAESNRLAMIRQEAAWAARSPSARTTKQKARLQRLDALQSQRPLPREAEFALPLKSGMKLGSTLFELHGVSKGYGDRTLIDNLTLVLAPGDRVGVVGPNGTGKTTLLKLLTGEEQADKGQLLRGGRVRIGLVDQARSELKDDDTLFEAAGGGNDQVKVGDEWIHVISFLYRFLFRREQLDQRVAGLSGGEKARLLLAKLLLQGANVLLLDEPTNDLDLLTLRVLEEALLQFDGSVVVVTHDRAFLDRVCTQVLAFEGDGKLTLYASRLQALEAAQRRESERRAALQAQQATVAAAPAPRTETRRLSYKEKQELEGLPEAIEAAEEEVAAIEAKLADPATYTDGTDVAALDLAHTEKQSEVERLYARWEELAELA
ncbi:MAG: ABC transporter ATP-binding protein [Deltaproteobacteria bacterium]|nr:MAG: ABC transporter ATP-binding protein [Deltaproteobacteria bacterium]